MIAMKRKSKEKTAGGFTLTELLVTMTILGLVMAGLTSFYYQSTVMMFTSDQKLKINADVRNITNELTDNARDANHFTMYDDFYDSFRTQAPYADWRKRDGESGDVLVLIYYGDDPNPLDTVPPPIVKLIGYYRSIDNQAENTGPVRRFDYNVPVAQQLLKVEQLVPDSTQESTFSQVIELSRGLADGKLFYNFRDRSIMVNGQIYHGNDAKRVTDTYNFTISPRG